MIADNMIQEGVDIGDRVVISLGGSLIAPDGIDRGFVKRFSILVKNCLRKKKVVLVCGGGKTARQYQESAKALGADDATLDWIGIYSTYLNALTVKSALGDIADKKLVTNPSKKITFKISTGSKKEKNYDVVVCTGWKPGWSTDYDATLIAKNLRCNYVINLSNQDYVYSADPRKKKDAKPIRNMTWDQFIKMFGSTWSPGKHSPFDPIAAKLASKSGINVIIASGSDFTNSELILSGKGFKGTVIR